MFAIESALLFAYPPVINETWQGEIPMAASRLSIEGNSSSSLVCILRYHITINWVLLATHSLPSWRVRRDNLVCNYNDWDSWWMYLQLDGYTKCHQQTHCREPFQPTISYRYLWNLSFSALLSLKNRHWSSDLWSLNRRQARWFLKRHGRVISHVSDMAQLSEKPCTWFGFVQWFQIAPP